MGKINRDLITGNAERQKNFDACIINLN